MKTIILLSFLLLIQAAHSGYEVTTDPIEPKAGDVITINSWVFCPQSAATENIDGDLFSIELEGSNILNITSFYDYNVGCIMAPPVPISFEIGPLDEGTYNLSVSYQALDNMIPIGSATAGFNFSFQVGPAPTGGSPQVVNFTSHITLIFMAAMVFLLAFCFRKTQRFENK